MSQSEGRLLAARYRLLSQVGRGGMGTVWKARDEVLDRFVAVKEVKVSHGLSDRERELVHMRTMREARATARLSHPGIVTVHDVIDEDHRPWIVMEFVQARTLQEVIDGEGPITPGRAAEIGRQVLAALREAHAARILHRDVKPSNILLRTGHEAGAERAVLTDFGIATLAGDTTLTQAGQVLGSPAYMAPERVQGGSATPASDLWALGASLYTACEGKPAHQRADFMSTFAAIVNTDPAPPPRAGPLAPVILHLLARDPAHRMTAETAAGQLDRIARDAPMMPAGAAGVSGTTMVAPAAPTAPALTGSPRTGARKARTAGLIGLAALVAAAVLAGVVLWPRIAGAWREDPPGARPPASSPPPAVPAGFAQAREADFAILVPKGWKRRIEGNSIKWLAASGAYVQVDRTAWSGNAYAHWQLFERQVKAEGALPGYRRIRLERVSHRDYDAADLEFTWTRANAGRMRGRDRGIVAAGRPYAIFFAAPEQRWADYDRGREVVLDSFRTTAPSN